MFSVVDEFGQFLKARLQAVKAEVTWDLVMPTNDKGQDGQTKASLHVYDVREAVEYRDNTPVRELTDGAWKEKKPPMLLNVAFLICSQTEIGSGSHKVTVAAAQFVRSHSQISEKMLSADEQKKYPELVESLKIAAVRLTLVADGPLGQPELWNAMGVKQRPSLTLVAAIALPDIEAPIDGPPVVVRTLRTYQEAATEDVEIHQIYAVELRGKVILNGKPLSHATVISDEFGEAVTDRGGSFVQNAQVPAGDQSLRFRVHGVREKSGKNVAITGEFTHSFVVKAQLAGKYETIKVACGDWAIGHP